MLYFFFDKLITQLLGSNLFVAVDNLRMGLLALVCEGITSHRGKEVLSMVIFVL